MKRLLSLITMATLLSCLTADEASAQRNRRQQRWIPQPTFRENLPQPYQNQVDRLERQGRYGRARRIREGQLRRTQQQQRIWQNGGAWGPARRFNQGGLPMRDTYDNRRNAPTIWVFNRSYPTMILIALSKYLKNYRN
jgi:hypothetical protein